LYDNGQKRIECYYRDDKEEGLYQEWDREGNLIKESNYIDGEEVLN